MAEQEQQRSSWSELNLEHLAVEFLHHPDELVRRLRSGELFESFRAIEHSDWIDAVKSLLVEHPDPMVALAWFLDSDGSRGLQNMLAVRAMSEAEDMIRRIRAIPETDIALLYMSLENPSGFKRMQQYRKLERNQLVAQLWEMTARIQEIAPGLPKLADLKERIRIECPMALDDGDRVTIEEGGTRHQGVVETSGEVKYITLESGERRALDVIAPARIRYDAEDKTLLDTIYAARSGSVTSDVLPTDASHTRSAMTGFVVGLVGCSLLLLGVFAPIVSAPIVGELNYFRNGEGDGVIVLGLMGVAVVMILARVIRYLLIPGIGSLLLVLYTFINLRVTLSREHDQVQAQLGDNPFRALADVGLGLVQLEYGWALLLLGALFLIIASALAPPAARYQK